MPQKSASPVALFVYIFVVIIAFFAAAFLYWSRPTIGFWTFALTGAILVILSGQMKKKEKELAHDLFIIAAYISLLAGWLTGMVAGT